MISFKDYLKENLLPKKYIAVYFTEETNKKLYNYAISQNFDISYNWDRIKIDPKKFKFHCTLFYSKNRMDIENITYKVPPLKSKVLGLRVFGNKKDVLVLRLDNAFGELRKKYLDMGLKDTFPKWRPHVSVSYKYDNKEDIASVANLPDFELVASHVTIEDHK
jgi:2'-5' RNA ligase